MTSVNIERLISQLKHVTIKRQKTQFYRKYLEMYMTLNFNKMLYIIRFNLFSLYRYLQITIIKNNNIKKCINKSDKIGSTCTEKIVIII